MKSKTRRRFLLVGVVLAVVAGTFAALRTVRTDRRRGHPRAETFNQGVAAQLLHVVDGDTAYFTLPGGPWVKGRLAGINTPECHKKQLRIAGTKRRSARCDRDDEYYGVKAYRRLLKLLKGAKLTLGCTRKRDGSCRRGRHGRVLITIQAGGKDVAE